jgi:hypothetical protein
VAVSGRTWRRGWAAARPSERVAGRGAPPTSSAPPRASRRRAPGKGTAGSGRVGSRWGQCAEQSRTGDAGAVPGGGRDANAMANTECESANVTMQSW